VHLDEVRLDDNGDGLGHCPAILTRKVSFEHLTLPAAPQAQRGARCFGLHVHRVVRNAEFKAALDQRCLELEPGWATTVGVYGQCGNGRPVTG
jgi:hypothetical protein